VIHDRECVANGIKAVDVIESMESESRATSPLTLRRPFEEELMNALRIPFPVCS